MCWSHCIRKGGSSLSRLLLLLHQTFSFEFVIFVVLVHIHQEFLDFASEEMYTFSFQFGFNVTCFQVVVT
jgi:hypothetical protein